MIWFLSFFLVMAHFSIVVLILAVVAVQCSVIQAAVYHWLQVPEGRLRMPYQHGSDLVSLRVHPALHKHFTAWTATPDRCHSTPAPHATTQPILRSHGEGTCNFVMKTSRSDILLSICYMFLSYKYHTSNDFT